MVNHLGLPKTEMPFYDTSCYSKAQKLYARVMAEGNFRRPNHFKYRKPKGYIAKKTHSFIGIFVDFFQLAKVFPTQAFHEMQTKLKSAFSKNFQKKWFFFASYELIVYFCREKGVNRKHENNSNKQTNN